MNILAHHTIGTAGSTTLRSSSSRMRKMVCVAVSYAPLAAVLLGCSLLASIGAADGPPFEPIVEIPNGKALVYVYKPVWYGRAIHKVRANGRTFTKLQKRGYNFLFVSPGRTKISTQDHTISSVDFVAEAGETYYVRSSGLAIGFEMTSGDAALAELPDCVLLRPWEELRIDELTDEELLLSTVSGKMLLEKDENYDSGKLTITGGVEELLDFLRYTPLEGGHLARGLDGRSVELKYAAVVGEEFGDTVSYVPFRFSFSTPTFSPDQLDEILDSVTLIPTRR